MVINSYSEAVTLTLNASSGGYMMTVGSDSTEQETVGSLISVTINSQTLMVGQNGTVTLPDNSTVLVSWQQNPNSPQTIQISITGNSGLRY